MVRKVGDQQILYINLKYKKKWGFHDGPSEKVYNTNFAMHLNLSSVFNSNVDSY